MVLEVFAAISLASNILQFVDFSSKLIYAGHEIYSAAEGASSGNLQLETVTRDLQGLANNLTTHHIGPTQADKQIYQLAHSCQVVAERLVDVLWTLKVNNGPHRKWQSFYQALRTVWKREEINELRATLGELREELTLHLLKLIGDQQSSVSADIRALSETSKRMDITITKNLNQIQATLRDIEEADIRKPGFHDSQNGVSYLSAKLGSVLDVGRKITAKQVLKSLQYESMYMRKSQIDKAQAETFDWIFRTDTLPSDDPRSGICFLDWLQYGSGTYWMSGKPGSGKSTLMEYLCEHKKTKEALLRWTDGQSASLVTASFFFWYAGTVLQNSQQGLLQSLLYEVLRQCPSLIQSIIEGRACDDIGSPWTHTQLSNALRSIAHDHGTSTKFCFFVDGLDEYDGDHKETVELLNELTTSGCIKLCVSSRPWNIFQDAYGKDPDKTLRLQDLTRDDIRQYTRAKLEEDKEFQHLQITDSRYQDLVEEIVQKAEGVFLWVVLVVRSLRRGVTNADTVPTLQKRLIELPSDLENFFKHILERVEKVYSEGTTQAFRMAMVTESPLFLWLFSVLDQVDPEFAIKATPKVLSEDQVHNHCKILEKRLIARCQGLLEVRTFPVLGAVFSRYLVVYMHRTVHDFLRLRDMQTWLDNRLKMPFCPHVALCNAQLAIAKSISIPSRTDKFHAYDDIFRNVTYHACEAEKVHGLPQTALLDELSRVIFGNSTRHPHPYFFQRPLLLYFGEKLEKDPDLVLTDIPSTPLYAAIYTEMVTTAPKAPISWKTVDLLLRYGANPNQICSGNDTAWKAFLGIINARRLLSNVKRKELYPIAKKLLEYDANPHVKVEGRDVSSILSVAFTEAEAADLENIVRRKRDQAKTSIKQVASQKPPSEGSVSPKQPESQNSLQVTALQPHQAEQKTREKQSEDEGGWLRALSSCFK